MFPKLTKRTFSRISKKAGKATLRHFLKNYSNQGYETNTGSFKRWADRKNEAKYTKQKLFKTGKMKSSFELSFPSSSEFEITNTTPYALYHQNGTSKMPARPIMYESENVDKIIEEEVFRELDRLFLK